MKDIIDNLDFIKIKIFSIKDDVKITRRQAIGWEKKLQKIYLIRDCYLKYKEELKLNSKKTKVEV